MPVSAPSWVVAPQRQAHQDDQQEDHAAQDESVRVLLAETDDGVDEVKLTGGPR